MSIDFHVGGRRRKGFYRLLSCPDLRRDLKYPLAFKERLMDDLVLRIKDPAPRVFPADGHSVRETSAVKTHGRWFAYADVVDWSNPHHPNTYNTAIHLFTSSDGCQWEHKGLVLAGGGANDWDKGGVASPGAAWFRGKLWLFYSGREFADGRGHRHIGLAVAESPEGPFRKLPTPVATGGRHDHTDDPCPVVSPEGDELRLYYRHARSDGYKICLASAEDPESPWHLEGAVLHCAGDVRAMETTEAKVFGSTTLVLVMEQFHEKPGIKTGAWLSDDGRRFERSPHRYVESDLDITYGRPMGSHLTLYQDEAGVVEKVSLTRVIDDAGHYTQCVFDVEAIGP